MIRHHHEVMQMVLSPVAISDRVDYDLGNPLPAQVLWAYCRAVEEPVHDRERPSGCGRIRKGAVGRKAAMEPPGNEHGLADTVIKGAGAGHEKLSRQQSGFRFVTSPRNVGQDVILRAGWQPAQGRVEQPAAG
jgi:hypothetical protein